MAASVKNKRPTKSKNGKKTSAKSDKKKAPAKRSAKKTVAKKKVVKKIKKALAKKVNKPVKKSSPAKKKTAKKSTAPKKKVTKKIIKKSSKTVSKKVKKSAKKAKNAAVKSPKKIVKKTAPAKKKIVKKAVRPAKKPVKKSAPAKKMSAKPVVKIPFQKPVVPQPKPVAPVTAPQPQVASQPKPVIQAQAPAETGLSTGIQGVALIEAVINKIQKDGLKQLGGFPIDAPKPLSSEQIESLTFPGGKTLSPCIKRWLRFDSSWLESLGWLTRTEYGVSFTGKTVSEFAAKEYGEDMKEFFASLDKIFDGFLFLLPLGSDSRRALYVGKTDELGEYPVFYTDIDDGADVGLMYPGFDVYMADLVGLFHLDFGTYTALCTHPAFRSRMKTHSDNNLRGRTNIDYFEAEDMLDD